MEASESLLLLLSTYPKINVVTQVYMVGRGKKTLTAVLYHVPPWLSVHLLAIHPISLLPTLSLSTHRPACLPARLQDEVQLLIIKANKSIS